METKNIKNYDVEIISQEGKFTTIILLKTYFSGTYSKFESFLPLIRHIA